jgi:predicted esterase
MIPLVPETIPTLTGVPVLIAAGRHDSIVPADEAEELASLLRSAGAVVSISVEEAGHGLTGQTMESVRAWLGGL